MGFWLFSPSEINTGRTSILFMITLKAALNECNKNLSTSSSTLTTGELEKEKERELSEKRERKGV